MPHSPTKKRRKNECHMSRMVVIFKESTENPPSNGNCFWPSDGGPIHFVCPHCSRALGSRSKTRLADGSWSALLPLHLILAPQVRRTAEGAAGQRLEDTHLEGLRVLAASSVAGRRYPFERLPSATVLAVVEELISWRLWWGTTAMERRKP